MSAQTWNETSVLALSGDAQIQRDGKKLATPAKWSGMETSGEIVWALCQGSGKDPYQVALDLSEPAFRCSCPSRKFPCKHGIALFLLFIGQRAKFSEAPLPEWVNDWLEKRKARAEKEAAKESGAKAAPVDVEAQAERAQARDSKVQAGLQELRLWLRDLVRRGFADEQVRSYAYWDRMASRLVDAQAATLARRLRSLATIPIQGKNDWASRLLDELSLIYLLADTYTRIDRLPSPLQEEIRTAIGWATRKEEILDQPALSDTWLVAAQVYESDENLRTRRVWLHGKKSGRKALLLDFAVANTRFEGNYVPGQRFDAELVYYPSASPQRAIIKHHSGAATIDDNDLTAFDFSQLSQMLDAYSSALAQNPWLEVVPIGLRDVVPYRHAGQLWLRDGEGRTVSVELRQAQMTQAAWNLSALTGNLPANVFGEWDGANFMLQTFVANGTFYSV